MAAFAVVMFSDKLRQPLLEAVFTGVGCLAACATVLLVAFYSFLSALDVTLRTRRGRLGRIIGAWLFSGPFIAGLLFMGYVIFRQVFLPR